MSIKTLEDAMKEMKSHFGKVDQLAESYLAKVAGQEVSLRNEQSVLEGISKQLAN